MRKTYKKVCYGILKPDNTLWMSESCICEDADVLRNEELPGINDAVVGKCKVVPLYVKVVRDDAVPKQETVASKANRQCRSK